MESIGPAILRDGEDREMRSTALVSPGVQRLAGACAVIAGVIGFLYSASFVVVAAGAAPQLGLGPSWVLLLFGSFALVVVYLRVREVEPTVALWSLVLGAAGAIGAAVHGAYELALSLNPPAATQLIPSEIDPRGFLTFGMTALALFGISWLMRRGGGFPGGLARLGISRARCWCSSTSGDWLSSPRPTRSWLVPAALEGFIVNPVWYIWLGLSLPGARPRLTQTRLPSPQIAAIAAARAPNASVLNRSTRARCRRGVLCGGSRATG